VVCTCISFSFHITNFDEVLCGDSICNLSIGKDCVSCFLDCTKSSCNVCGDSVCDLEEDCYLCFKDVYTSKVITSLVKVDSNSIYNFSVLSSLTLLKKQPPINLFTLVFVILQSNTSNVATTNYSTSLLNSAHLLISLLLFLQPTNILFAGTTTTYASNTLSISKTGPLLLLQTRL